MGSRLEGVAARALALTALACSDPEAGPERLLSEALSVSEAAAAPSSPSAATPVQPSASVVSPQPPSKPDREKLLEWQGTSAVVFPKGMRIRINAHYRDVVGRHRVLVESTDCPNARKPASEGCVWAGLRMALESEPGHEQIAAALRSCLTLATLKLEHPKQYELSIVFERPEGRVTEPLDPDFGYNAVAGAQHSFQCILE